MGDPIALADRRRDVEEVKKPGGGGKLARSETVTVRLDPKLRYLAELAARKQRRTLSSYIEWAIEENLKSVYLAHSPSDLDLSVASEAENLWDVDEADRFVKLAFRYPHMLTHYEQLLWKLVRENGYLWKGHHSQKTAEWVWDVREEGLDFERFREHWDKFIAVARGEADKSALPRWLKHRSGDFSKLGDDEIPF